MSSEEPSTNQDFNGIWDRNNKKSDITNDAAVLAEIKPEVGAKKKTWGIPSVLISFAIFLGLQVVVSFGAVFYAVATDTHNDPVKAIQHLLASPWLFLLGGLSMYAVWLGSMAFATYVRGQKSFKKDFGLAFKKWDIFIGLGLAVLGFIVVNSASWLFGDVFHLNMKGSDNGSQISSFSGIWLIIIAGGVASILGPFCEELFFRGFTLRAVIKSIQNTYARVTQKEHAPRRLRLMIWLDKYKNVIAIIASSTIFGFMHFQGFETFGQWFVVLATGTLGLIFGICAVKFGRLGPTIFGHIFYNGGTLLLAILLQNQ